MRAVTILVLIAFNMAFGWMSRGVFLPTGMAYERALTIQRSALEDLGIAEDAEVQRVYWAGSGLFERIVNVPAIYQGFYHAYPVQEFIWVVDDNGNSRFVWVGILPNLQGVHAEVGLAEAAPFQIYNGDR